MDELSLSIWILAGLFLLVAFAYSSVGLGGGSSYTALMAIAGVGAMTIPIVSLILNLLVTSAGSYHFIRNRHARLNLIFPFLVSSMPMAYLGGALQIPKSVFYWILLLSLVFIALRIYVWNSLSLKLNLSSPAQFVIALAAGAVLGLLAGIVGIGGGIYLVPLIILLNLGTPKEAAASGAIFIWLNSITGLISRLQYNRVDLTELYPLIIAVLIGGVFGSWIGATKLKPVTMEKILGAIILIAIVILAKKVFI